MQTGQSHSITEARAWAEGRPLNLEDPHGYEIRQALAAMLASAAFRNSLRLTRFISFVVEATLAGRAGTLKGYTIAVGALGRGSDFDPQTDPIVRVEAGRLRQALARYYAEEGRNDRVLIELPRGTYVPTFTRPGITKNPKLTVVPEERPPPLLTDIPEPYNKAETAGSVGKLGLHLTEFHELAQAQRTQLAALAETIQRAKQTLQHSQELLFATIESNFIDHVPRSSASSIRGETPGTSLPNEKKPAPETDMRAAAFQMLDTLSARLLSARNLEGVIAAILDAAIDLHQADFSITQLLDERTHQLVICGHRGFDRSFLKACERVSAADGCASARALRQRTPVIVQDVLTDAEYLAFRPIAAEAGFRAVMSTPLIATSGRFIGTASAVFARPYAPSPLDMLMMQFYARLAADTVARLARR
jgi:hypothetical protein